MIENVVTLYYWWDLTTVRLMDFQALCEYIIQLAIVAVRGQAVCVQTEHVLNPLTVWWV